MPVSLSSSQLVIAIVVLLVVAALLVALIARALVSRKAGKRAPPAELPPERQRETLPPPTVGVEAVAPPERVAREQRAREELDEAEASLRTAREAFAREQQCSAGRAGLDG